MPTVLNMAKEQTNRSGTGSPYTLTGAVSPFSTFVARATEEMPGSSPWSSVWYCCTDNNGAWEIGYGTLTDAASDTITRATIVSSSNGGAAVNWPSADAKDIYSWAPGSELTGILRQHVIVNDTTKRDITATINYDGSIPGSTEGTSFVSASITPTDAASIIKVTVSVPVCYASGTNAIVAGFQGTTCIGAGTVTANDDQSFHAVWYYVAGSTTSQTVSIRGGDTGAGNFYINRDNGTPTLLSTAAKVTLVLEELAP